MLPVLLLVIQASAWTVMPTQPTVGDTVVISRRVSVAAGTGAQVPPLESSALLTPLAPPRWSVSEGSLEVAYTVALFESGRHTISMPDVVLVDAAGRRQVLGSGTVVVDVASVLVEPETAEPRPSLGPLAHTRVTLIPLIASVLIVLAALIMWGGVRRRTNARPLPFGVEGETVAPAIDAWVAAGESRAVAAVVANRLRDALARLIPEAGRHLHAGECIRVVEERSLGEVGRELADVIRALERARFSPAAPADVLEVVDDAERVLRALQSAVAPRS